MNEQHILPRTARVRVIKSHIQRLYARLLFVLPRPILSIGPKWHQHAEKIACHHNRGNKENPVRVKYFPRQETVLYRTPMGYHNPGQTNPYLQGNVQGVPPSSLDSSISNVVKEANLKALATTRELHVHTHTSHLLNLATTQR